MSPNCKFLEIMAKAICIQNRTSKAGNKISMLNVEGIMTVCMEELVIGKTYDVCVSPDKAFCLVNKLTIEQIKEFQEFIPLKF